MYRAAPFGPFINRNHFAGWMLMVLPLAAAAACGSAGGERLRGVREFLGWLSASPAAAQMLLLSTAAAIMGLSVRSPTRGPVSWRSGLNWRFWGR